MNLRDDAAKLEALIATLDSTAQVVIKIIRNELRKVRTMLALRDAQLAEFQRMLSGKRSESLPPIEEV